MLPAAVAFPITRCIARSTQVRVTDLCMLQAAIGDENESISVSVLDVDVHNVDTKHSDRDTFVFVTYVRLEHACCFCYVILFEQGRNHCSRRAWAISL